MVLLPTYKSIVHYESYKVDNHIQFSLVHSFSRDTPSLSATILFLWGGVEDKIVLTAHGNKLQVNEKENFVSIMARIRSQIQNNYT